MRIIDILLRRSRAYRLRRKYDKLREKADRDKNIDKRIAVLRMMDQIEPTIVLMEEGQVASRRERKRMAYNVLQGLKKVELILKDEEYYMSMMQRGTPQNPRR